MRKVLLSLGLVASLFGADKLLPKSKIDSILSHTLIDDQIKRKFRDIKVKGVAKKDFYIITFYNQRGEMPIYITKDYKYIIIGQIVDNKTNRPVVANYPVEPFKGNKEIVKNGVMFSFGDGKEDLYVVTDPECPFCRRFEKQAQKYNLSKKYKIHIIFFPLPFHKHAKDMIYYILSGKDDKERSQRFQQTLTGDKSWRSFKLTKSQKEKIDKEIEKSMKAVKELKTRGTPTFYDKNFNEKDRRTIFK